MKIYAGLILWLGATVGMIAAERSYVGEGVQAGAKGWRYTLTLHEQGRAVLRTVKSPQRQMMESAVWTRTDAGDLSLQFLNRERQPRGEPLVWREAAGRLTPLTWDKAEWGEAGPPVLRGD